MGDVSTDEVIHRYTHQRLIPIMESICIPEIALLITISQY
jgi:hypothetical protein